MSLGRMGGLFAAAQGRGNASIEVFDQLRATLSACKRNDGHASFAAPTRSNKHRHPKHHSTRRRASCVPDRFAWHDFGRVECHLGGVVLFVTLTLFQLFFEMRRPPLVNAWRYLSIDVHHRCNSFQPSNMFEPVGGAAPTPRSESPPPNGALKI